MTTTYFVPDHPVPAPKADKVRKILADHGVSAEAIDGFLADLRPTYNLLRASLAADAERLPRAGSLAYLKRMARQASALRVLVEGLPDETMDELEDLLGRGWPGHEDLERLTDLLLLFEVADRRIAQSETPKGRPTTAGSDTQLAVVIRAALERIEVACTAYPGGPFEEVLHVFLDKDAHRAAMAAIAPAPWACRSE
jgi:hypothetical protein